MKQGLRWKRHVDHLRECNSSYQCNNIIDNAFMMLSPQTRKEPHFLQEELITESWYPTRNRRPPERLTYKDHVTPTANWGRK